MDIKYGEERDPYIYYGTIGLNIIIDLCNYLDLCNYGPMQLYGPMELWDY